MKSLAAPYEAGRRGSGWVKVKPRHTLDLVVLAVEWGSGRRQGLLSNIHLGAADPATGGFAMLGKTFKGMTDEMLAVADRAVPRRWRPRRTATSSTCARSRSSRSPSTGVQRSSPLPRRAGAALRPGAALPRRQAGRRRSTPSRRCAASSAEPDAHRCCNSELHSAYDAGHDAGQLRPAPAAEAARPPPTGAASARPASSRRPASSSTPAGSATRRSRTSPGRWASTGRSSTGTSPARRSSSRSPSRLPQGPRGPARGASTTRRSTPRPGCAASPRRSSTSASSYPAFIDCGVTILRMGPAILDELSSGALYRLGRGMTDCLARVVDMIRAGTDAR